MSCKLSITTATLSHSAKKNWKFLNYLDAFPLYPVNDFFKLKFRSQNSSNQSSLSLNFESWIQIELCFLGISHSNWTKANLLRFFFLCVAHISHFMLKQNSTFYFRQRCLRYHSPRLAYGKGRKLEIELLLHPQNPPTHYRNLAGNLPQNGMMFHWSEMGKKIRVPC